MIEKYKQIMEKQKNMNAVERQNYQVEQRNSLIDQKLMMFINNNALDLFISGGAGSRFPDEDNLAFTNAGIVLCAIYRAYEKYPDRKIDDLFEQSLIKLLNQDVGEFYTALNTINTQLYNEQTSTSPFKIDNTEVFVTLKEQVKKHEEYLRNSMSYRGRLYDNKLYGFVEEIDRQLEQQKGVKIL